MNLKEFEVCKCDKNPAINFSEFDTLISEYGSMENILVTKIEATCKTCNERFEFVEDKTTNKDSE